MRFTKRQNTLSAIAISTLLAACGSNVQPEESASATTSAPAASFSAQIILSAAQERAEKDAGSENMLNLADGWPDWNGQPSGITYNPIANNLLIPAPGQAVASHIRLGVQRYDQPLLGRYKLSVDSSDSQVAALIFLFDQTGQILPIRSHDGPLYVASANQPLDFDAPVGTAGFYVQVQSGWRAGTPAALRPGLARLGFDRGNNIIDPLGPWLGWTGEQVEVSYDASGFRQPGVNISAPPDGIGNTIGVQRIQQPLIAGREYELAIYLASGPSSLLLFLIGDGGQPIPFIDPADGQSYPWIATMPDGPPRRFVAPEGVAGIAAQIQSEWNATSNVHATPSLIAVPASAPGVPVPGPFAYGIPAYLAPVPVTCRKTRRLNSGAVYEDSGPYQSTYVVNNGVFSSGEGNQAVSGPIARVLPPDLANNDRRLLVNGDIEYKTTVVSKFSHTSTLIVNPAGDYEASFANATSRAGSGQLACGEGVTQLPGLRALRATPTPFAASDILAGPGGGFSNPAISEEGQTVAYRDNTTDEVIVLERATGTVRRFAGLWPVLSGDGRFLVVAAPSNAYTAEDAQLQLIDLLTGAITALGRGIPDVSMSSDGNIIAFDQRIAGDDGSTRWSALVLNRTTGELHNFGPDIGRMRPRVTRNGRYATFISSMPAAAPGPDQAGGLRLDLQSGQLAQLVAPDAIVVGTDTLISSENGRLIAHARGDRLFLRDLTLDTEIEIVVDYVRNPDGASAVFAQQDNLLVFHTAGLFPNVGMPLSEPGLTVFYDTGTGAFNAYSRVSRQVPRVAVRADGLEVVQIEGLPGNEQVVIAAP